MVDSFGQWLKKAKPGDRVVYYEGFLLQDRTSWIVFADSSVAIPQAAVRAAANEAWAAYEMGSVILTQKRLGDGDYIYYATKRSLPRFNSAGYGRVR